MAESILGLLKSLKMPPLLALEASASGHFTRKLSEMKK
jgi:hypothetical protein